MKKLLVCAVFFFLVAGAAFAQLASGIWVNAWGRGAFVPLWYETPEMKFGTPVSSSAGIFKNGTGVTWDPINQPRVDFRVNAATDFVGFTIHVNSEYLAGTGNGDNGAQLWVKPFGNNWLKLTVANQFIEDALRGKVTTDTGFENFVLGKSMMKLPSDGIEPLNQDVTFNRFAGGRASVAAANATNTSTHISDASILENVFFLSSSPIDGLFIGLMLQGLFPDTDLKESWRQVHVGAGYEIPEIGHVRAQYIGGFMGKEQDLNDGYRLTEPSKFEVAFALSAVDNLVVDLGAKIWMPVTSADNRTVNPNTTSYRGLDIALGATYRYESLNIAFMGQALYVGAYTGARAHNPGNEKGADGVRLVFNLIPEYDFDFGTVGLSFIAQTKTADIRVDGTEAEKYADGGPWTRLGVGAWYRKSLAGGYIKVGVAYAFPCIAFGTPPSTLPSGGGQPVVPPDQTGFEGRGILSIPIILEYAFF